MGNDQFSKGVDPIRAQFLTVFHPLVYAKIQEKSPGLCPGFCLNGKQSRGCYAPSPKVLVGLSQRILRRDSAEILSLLLIAPTVLSGNLSMASLCG